MLKIRLAKFGKKNAPSYKIVVGDEVLGFFNPQEKKFSLNKERFDVWIKKGAKATKAVLSLTERKYEKAA